MGVILSVYEVMLPTFSASNACSVVLSFFSSAKWSISKPETSADNAVAYFFAGGVVWPRPYKRTAGGFFSKLQLEFALLFQPCRAELAAGGFDTPAAFEADDGFDS